MKKIFAKLNNYFSGHWQFAVLDLSAGRWIVKAEKSNIGYLKAENANGRHILIQPSARIASRYLLADDLPWQLIERHHKCARGKWKRGRMAVETSDRNFQVWIRSSRPLSLDEKRYWLKKLHSDPGADPNNRWGRCPGFRNRKEKYRGSYGTYPLSRLIWVDWRHLADIPRIHSCNPKSFSVSHNEDLFREHHRRNKIISRFHYDRGDESATDFAFALALLRNGYNELSVEQKIRSERSNWENHAGNRKMDLYLRRTITRAKQVIEGS